MPQKKSASADLSHISVYLIDGIVWGGTCGFISDVVLAKEIPEPDRNVRAIWAKECFTTQVHPSTGIYIICCKMKDYFIRYVDSYIIGDFSQMPNFTFARKNKEFFCYLFFVGRKRVGKLSLSSAIDCFNYCTQICVQRYWNILRYTRKLSNNRSTG